MSKKVTSGGPRGLERDALVAAAVALMEAEGPAAFSVRKVAARFGCDPMAVLYHVGSKDGLERAMAEALNERLRPVDPAAPWRARLADLAQQYRALALRFPNTFPLLLRFWVTGPADYRHAEMVYRALADAGLDDRDVVDFCFGFYAGMLGLAAAEAGGLLKPADARSIEEVRALAAAEYPMTTRLLEEFARQEPRRVYARMLEALLDGIEARRRHRPADPGGGP